MEIAIENILLFGSILLILSIYTSRTSYRMGVPTLFIFLIIGMIVGSVFDVFNDVKDAQSIGTIALIFILYSGGLDTRKKDIKPIIGQGIVLSFFGILITAGVFATFIYWVTDFSFIESLLIASIISSTDAAAVFSIFKSQNLGIDKNLRATLELESGSNDPTAYILTITVLDLILKPSYDIGNLIFVFLQSFLIGGLAGAAFGFITSKIINKINLNIDGLYPVLVLAISILTYSATAAINGNGYLAVYIAAIILGNSNFVHKRSIIKFFDGVSWLMQVIMFITLGLLVDIPDLIPIIGIGLLVSAFLMFVARPIAVALCLLPFRVPIKKQALIAWVGLRGAVPIIFAMYPLVAGIEHSQTIFSIIFFIAATSLLFQGMMIPKVAKFLKLVEPIEADNKIDIDKYANSIGEIAEISIKESTISVGKSIMELDLPTKALIVMIQRDGANITPNGSTILLPGDKLLVVAETRNVINELKKIIGFMAEDKNVKKKVLLGTEKKEIRKDLKKEPKRKHINKK